MENCENLKKMSFKGLEKWLRNIYTDVSILRYLDLACLPLYIIRIPVNCQWVSNAFPGRFSKNWWWATKFWFGHLSLIDKKIKSFDTLSLKIRPRTPGIRLFMMLLLWESVGRRRHLRLESLWMAMNLNRNDIMTVWNKCFFFMSQTIKISST